MIENVLNGKIKEKSVICTDGDSSYNDFVKKYEL